MSYIILGLMLILFIAVTVALISLDKKAFYAVRVFLIAMICFIVILLILKVSSANVFTSFADSYLSLAIVFLSILGLYLFGIFAKDTFRNPKIARLFLCLIVLMSFLNVFSD